MLCKIMIEVVNLLLSMPMCVVFFLFDSVIASKPKKNPKKHEISKKGNQSSFKYTCGFVYLFLSIYLWLKSIIRRQMHVLNKPRNYRNLGMISHVIFAAF